MSSKLINPSTVHDAWPTYSHVQSTRISPTVTLITLAGEVGVDKDGQFGKSFQEQVSVALENVRRCLASVSATPADIINMTHYVVGLDPNDTTLSEELLQFFAGHRPPGTLVGISTLANPNLLYEVQAQAIIHHS
ncbi:hypothetical protein RBB50_011480 [Rhinocladiella similis]